MVRVRCSLRLLVWVCLVAFTWAVAGDASAATKKAKGQIQTVAAKPTKLQSQQGETPAIPRANKSPMSTALESQPGGIQKQAKSARTELKATSLKRHRRSTVYRRKPPEAVVQPSTDLTYHGMLESSQRYDPRRKYRVGAGIPDPHNPELTRDHFQELDRNRDGSIDPVERVFGRLDMDRDLYDRRPR